MSKASRHVITIAAVNRMAEVVHCSPIGDSALTPCCAAIPFELPANHRMTLDVSKVTCGAKALEAQAEAIAAVKALCGQHRWSVRVDADGREEDCVLVPDLERITARLDSSDGGKR
jgi:hypothetical protein